MIVSPSDSKVMPHLEQVSQPLAALQGPEHAAALQELFRTEFHRLPIAEQPGRLTALAAATGLEMRELFRMAQDSFAELDTKGLGLRDLLERADALGWKPEQKGVLMVRWLDANGGKCFLDDRQHLIIVKDGRDMTVGRDVRFDSFLLAETGLTSRSKGMGAILAAFRAAAAKGARALGQPSWLFTDHANLTVYVHLNAAEHEIIRLGPAGLGLIENGSNNASVLLAPSTTTQRWSLVTLARADYVNALRSFDSLVLSRMACSRSDQLLFASWALTFPLMDFVRTHPHLRAEGSTGLGKTAGVDLMATLLCGSPEKVVSTSAFNYAEGSANPFLIWDNLEKGGMTPTLEQFLLLAATGGKRGKRIPGTMSATVREEIRCLTCSTGIENLGRGELIGRTIHLEFDRNRYGNRPIIASDIEEIKTQRSTLLSAHMQLVQKVLARIAAGELAAWQDRLDTRHFLARANDFIALMALIAEELLPIIEPQRTVAELVQSWIDEQDQYGRQTTREASQIVTLAEALLIDMDTYNAGLTPARWSYDVRILSNGQLTGLSGEWFRTFAALKAKKRLRFDIADAGQLTRRLKDAKPALASAGLSLDWVYDTHKKVTRFTLGRMSGSAASISTDMPGTDATPAPETLVAA